MKWRPRKKDLDIVSNIIISLGIDHLAMKDITMISGGERQKELSLEDIRQHLLSRQLLSLSFKGSILE